MIILVMIIDYLGHEMDYPCQEIDQPCHEMAYPGYKMYYILSEPGHGRCGRGGKAHPSVQSSPENKA